MKYEKIMKQLKSFNFTDAQRKKLASIILKLDKEKQDILVSGDNIATINGQSLLNGGNISLIKTGIFTIVTKLPTNDIDKDKVYLVPSTKTDNENKFSEYIYTDNGWEKLGTFTAEIDLSNYVQHTDVVTNTTNGLMLASDKTKLDSLVNYQAGNGIDITGDTISCTLDTSLYSIVTELPETGLTNKIYLLPSTETEEGNIYTEYGYVDNKWEELGKYKADVDLSPYSMALALPLYIIGMVDYKSIFAVEKEIDGEGLFLKIAYRDLKKVTGGYIKTIIPLVTDTTNGLISPSDKAKLDSQPTIKASNATGVTDDDYIVIKKSELNSILSRLSALENKA